MHELNEPRLGTPSAQSELERINNEISKLNNYAVDIGLKIEQFNDRVQGAAPQEVAGQGGVTGNSTLISGINETLGYLRSALNKIDNQVSRLDNIG